MVVVEVFRGVDERSGWELNLARNFNDWEVDEFTLLLQLLVHLEATKTRRFGN